MIIFKREIKYKMRKLTLPSPFSFLSFIKNYLHLSFTDPDSKIYFHLLKPQKKFRLLNLVNTINELNLGLAIIEFDNKMSLSIITGNILAA